MLEPLSVDEGRCVFAKERSGCISLWSQSVWEAKINARISVAKQKLQSGLLEGEMSKVQLLGRLLSTRHEKVDLAGRGRILIPEGFRDFLGVHPNKEDKSAGEVIVVGAAICIEIWQPKAWLRYLERRMPRFRKLIDVLS